MEDLVIKKSRKLWQCEYCGLPILVGSSYTLIRYRAPRINDADKQEGIAYVQVRTHADLDFCNKHLVAIGAIDPV